jgi:hypothetical protein
MCDCMVTGVNAAKPILKNDCVALDVLLETSSQIKVHWPRILQCENCCTNEQLPSTLNGIALRLVGFYEVALRNYSAQTYFESQHLTFPGQAQQNNASSGLRVSSSSSFSTRNEMMLGKLAINEEESQMLVQLLLSDYLVSLHDLLNQVSCQLEEDPSQWQSNQWIKSNQVLSQTIERVASLIGRLAFNTKKRKQSFGHSTSVA